MVKKSNAGRPTVMTKEVIVQLEHAFSNCLTDLEACIYAGISKDALYNYIQKNPEFHDRKEHLKKQVGIKAKLNVVKKISDGSEKESKWWLERKAKDEFSTRSELTGEDGKEIEVRTKLNEEDKAILDRFIAEREKS